MSLAAGATIGSYLIEAPLGAGGMGEVYRARDTKLNRDVAIKVLPELFAGDAERLTRFTREAQTLAALNHPNIAHIHGLEESPSTGSGQAAVRALVMELVEGEDLSARIARGPVPIAETLEIARQIADALEAAHEQGIVHRDLKPANVKVRPDGTVKVLDFGLAKAMERSAEAIALHPSSAEALHSPTLTARATQMGMIIGTAAYMAPEQARGKAVDRRADIWAFGVVLYEMLTGRRAFDPSTSSGSPRAKSRGDADTLQDVLASVLRDDVQWQALPADLPAPLRRLLRRCLEKDPRRRLSAIGDARLELDDAAGSAEREVAIPVTAAAVPVWRRVVPLAVTALIAGISVAAVMTLRAPAATAPDVVRFSLMTDPESPLFRSPALADFALSHDGRTLAFLTAGIGVPQLNLRRLSDLRSVRLDGGDNVTGPFLSPDDRWIGFFDPSRIFIKKIPITGGRPVTVVTSKNAMLGATWLADGTIVYGVSGVGLMAVPDGGGTPVPLTKIDPAFGDTNHLFPAAIPGTGVVLFGIVSGDPIRSGRLAAVDRATGRFVRTAIPGNSPRFLPTGHIIYATTDAALHVVPFDVRRLEVTGPAVPTSERVGMKASGLAFFDVADDGRLAYSTYGVLTGLRTLVWVDRAGKESPVGAPPRAYFYARISPDGERLSLDVRDQDQDIWVWDARGTLSRVTPGPEADRYGLWMPDGRHILMASSVDGKEGIYRMRADGVGTQELVLQIPAAFPNAVTPDGRQLIFRTAVGTKGENDLFIVSLEGEHTVKTLLGTESDELNAEISPDGRWMAYQSNHSGATEVYVRPFPDVAAGQWKVSIAGGAKPAWVSGRELVYLAAGGGMMSVPVDTTRGFVPRTPVRLFDAAHYFSQGAGRNFSVSSDGARFVMVKNPANVGASDPITIVMDAAADIAAKLPKSSR